MPSPPKARTAGESEARPSWYSVAATSTGVPRYTERSPRCSKANSAAVRAFGGDGMGIPLVKRLALAAGPDDLADRCEALGLPLSERSARRILDGAIAALDPLTERLAAESFPRQAHRPSERRRNSKNARSLRLAPEDIDALKRGIGRLMEPVAETYYLEAVGEAEVIVGQEAIRITVPIRTSL